MGSPRALHGIFIHSELQNALVFRGILLLVCTSSSWKVPPTCDKGSLQVRRTLLQSALLRQQLSQAPEVRNPRASMGDSDAAGPADSDRHDVPRNQLPGIVFVVTRIIRFELTECLVGIELIVIKKQLH